MNKAEKYLYERVNLLSNEKVMLITKVNEIDLEVEEIEYKIKELRKSIDDAFEIFSPRSKKSDFVKNEIESFEKKLEDLSILREKYDEQIRLVDNDIDIINEALGEEESDVDDYSYDIEIEDISDEINKKNELNINGINLIKEQENERKRIARELHDSTVQVLTNLVHKCEICAKFMDVDMVRSKLELEVMSKTLRETIDDLRNIIYNLRPMSFDDMGLDVTFNKIVNQARKDCDIDIKLEIKGEKADINEIKAITLIRVLQESINNSKKYSNANIIEVTLEYGEKYITIDVKDDGIGFDKSKIEKSDNSGLSGFGLSMMKERVFILDGKLDILSEPGKGTEIIVTLPIYNTIT